MSKREAQKTTARFKRCDSAHDKENSSIVNIEWAYPLIWSFFLAFEPVTTTSMKVDHHELDLGTIFALQLTSKSFLAAFQDHDGLSRCIVALKNEYWAKSKRINLYNRHFCHCLVNNYNRPSFSVVRFVQKKRDAMKARTNQIEGRVKRAPVTKKEKDMGDVVLSLASGKYVPYKCTTKKSL